MKLLDVIQANSSLQGPGIVAVSGGADSVALLCGMHELRIEVSAVCHFNHRLRGQDSEADEQFVCQLAGKLGLVCLVGAADIAAMPGNLEDNARNRRYDWLAETAAELQVKWIATGHNANDQAETVLQRLLRGSGISGLRGIAASRPIDNSSPIRLVRPILAVTRPEIVDYLISRGQDYCEDRSNSEVTFQRNRLRQQMLPLLQQEHAHVVTSLCQLAEQAEELDCYLQNQVDLWLTAAELPRAGRRVILKRSDCAITAPFLLRLVFHHLWQREGWSRADMTTAHWQRLAALSPGDYPGQIQLSLSERVVQLGPNS